MTRVRGEVTIDAPVEVVFDTVADEQNEPRDNPRIVRPAKLDDAPIGEGARFVAEPKGTGAGGRMALEIADFAPPPQPDRLDVHACRGNAVVHVLGRQDPAEVGRGHAAGRMDGAAVPRAGAGSAALGATRGWPQARDIDAAGQWLRDQDGCTGKIGVVGFCMGGGYAVALAADPGYSVSSVNYGGWSSDADQWLPYACPIVGSFGGSDHSPLGARAGHRLGELLTELEIPHDVKVCPGVGHGFMNTHDPEDQTPTLAILARISGTRYDEPANLDARRRISDFFRRYLAAE